MGVRHDVGGGAFSPVYAGSVDAGGAKVRIEKGIVAGACTIESVGLGPTTYVAITNPRGGPASRARFDSGTPASTTATTGLGNPLPYLDLVRTVADVKRKPADTAEGGAERVVTGTVDAEAFLRALGPEIPDFVAEQRAGLTTIEVELVIDADDRLSKLIVGFDGTSNDFHVGIAFSDYDTAPPIGEPVWAAQATPQTSASPTDDVRGRVVAFVGTACPTA